ncbi:hypothetical protein QZH41_006461 [Actinostola sp. cb2023]|nr:hypothetical protein QZH41_006461 [Actinostola sp. cb2023]
MRTLLKTLTPDRNHTFHGTAMAIYQRSVPEDKKPDLNVDTLDQSRSIRELPESITSLLECPKPPSKPFSPVYPWFGLFAENELPVRVRMQYLAWLLGRSLTSRTPIDSMVVTGTQTNIMSTLGQLENQSAKSTGILVWSGYNSLISNAMPVTRVGAPPLIAAPAHYLQVNGIFIFVIER